MFDTERFVADCRAAFAADPSHKAIHEVVARAMSEPSAVLKGLGEPKRPESRALFHSDKLTILNVVWPPGYIVPPHDHRMWAVIGVYSGREDNLFWRRIRGRAEPDRGCRRQSPVRARRAGAYAAPNTRLKIVSTCLR